MSDLVGHTLGQYELLEEIGHGGMANVYSAVQRSIGRKVAVKVLPAHFLQDRSFLERFSREVQVVARLHHPHILQVYDYGEQDGVPYIVMGYLEGGSLADLIRRSEGGLALGEVVPLVRQIAGALDYAHRKGIIHRDFKPSNVLLDTEGNAYLSDFGIAKVTEYTAQLTGSGYVGTPAYMAPEMTGQAELTPLVDIYALGATLYEMLTGQHPYSAQTPVGVLMAHVSQPVPDVRERRPDLPPAVQGVIERAMAKDPLNRYQTAGVLADDLEMALLGQQSAETAFAAEQTLIEHAPETEVGTLLDALPLPPVETMPVEETLSPAESRPKRRSALPIALGGLAAVIILALGLFAFWPRGEEPGGAAVVPTEGEGVSFPTATIPSSEEGTSVPTEESFSPTEQPATPTLTPPPTARTLSARIRARLPRRSGAREMAFSQNGQMLAVAYLQGLVLYRVDTLEPVWEVEAEKYIDGVTWSPDGTILATGSASDELGHRVNLWDVASGERLRTIEGNSIFPEDSSASVAWSPDGVTLASGSWNFMNVALWNVVSGERPRILEGPPNMAGGVTSMAWSPDGMTLAASSTEYVVILWSVATGEQLRMLEGHSRLVNSVAWSPDGMTLASGAWDNTIILWDAATGARLRTLEGHTDWLHSVAWSPDGTILASASVDQTVILWDVATGARLRTLEGHTFPIYTVAWSPDGKILASGSAEGEVIVWEVGQ